MIRRVATLFPLCSLFAVLGASPARADDPRRLALVGTDGTLVRSTAIALTPWNVQVVPVDAPRLADDVGVASRDARAIAERSQVDAVAWLSGASDTRALLLYDARTGQIVSREVAAGPIDDALAASIALSLKTLLRASTVAPREERIGAPEQAASTGLGALRLEADTTVRLRASNGVRFDPRLGLALVWWPVPFARWLGFALRIEEGTGLPVQSDELQGHLTDHALSLSARARLPLSRRFTLEPALGAGLHLTFLDGASVDGHGIPDVARVDPTVETSFLLAASLGRGVELGLRGGLSFWMRWQEYDVDNDQPALTLSPVQGTLGLVLGAALN